MTALYSDLKEALGPVMVVPKAFKLLFDWMQAQGLEDDGIGTLFPDDAMWAGWSESGRPGGTDIEFSTHRNEDLPDWFGHDKEEMLDRVCVFARTGGDGSMAAFWLDDAGQQVIVHLGSGSGADLCCVLTEDPVDFLRLLAIGYDEICWGDKFAKPPNADSRFTVQPNTAYQEWVQQTFNATIPTTASEIVQHIQNIDDNAPTDRFARWVRTGRGSDERGA